MKWRIKGITGKTSFSKSAGIILSKRLKDLLYTIKEYFHEESAENLHQIRIALRRLRYTLEVFYCCFDKNVFSPFYTMIENLQDISGTVRDLDVLKVNYYNFIQEGKESIPGVIVDIDKRKNELTEELKISLWNFVHSKEIKYFKNQISKRK